MTGQKLQFRNVLAALLMLCVQKGISKTSKPISRAVHEVFEVINERIDDRPPVFTAPGHLPYGNPLAGNSQQNARLHAQNQQAMFNAERRRQQKAQLHRWNNTPPRVDSYMKAYQESQEDHQFAVEQQQQVKQTDSPRHHPATTSPLKTRIIRPEGRRTTLDRPPKSVQSPEIMKITKEDAVVKEKSRNHRSYGSTDYHQYIEPKRYQTVYVSPAPTYDQGVTIKPNGNVGVSNTEHHEDQKLFTEAVPSKTQYVYPKQYQQMQSYQSAQEIEALSSLLQKSPNDQLSEFNSIINSGKEQDSEDELNRPIDLYFYLKDPSVQSLSQHYDHASYAQIPQNVQDAYSHALTLDHQTESLDHKPITEQVDDTENPYIHVKGKTYGFQTVPTQEPVADTTTTKNNNYYKVASQTISAGYKHAHKPFKTPRYHNIEALSHSHQTSHYEEEPMALNYKLQTDHSQDQSDTSERYLHNNGQHHGIQHLTEDGTGVSAYDDDNVSKTDHCSNCNKNRKPRSALETDPFYVPGNKPKTEYAVETNTTKAPKSEKFMGFNPYFMNKQEQYNTFVSSPNFGDALDYGFNDYEDSQRPYKRPTNSEFEKHESFYDDYEDEIDEFSSPDTEHVPQKPIFPINPMQNYAPSVGYHQNFQADLMPSFSNNYKRLKRYPSLSSGYNYPAPSFGTPITSYGVPAPTYGPPSTSYGVPLNYEPPRPMYHAPDSYMPTMPKYSSPTYNNIINIPRLIEPLYMLTQTQLKNIIGHHNLNIQHLDVYQMSKEKEKRPIRRPYPTPYPKKYRKKNPRLRYNKKYYHSW